MTGPADDVPATALTPEMLGRVPLFKGVAPDLLKALAAELRVRRASPGELVVREGEDANDMFIVVAGELEVVKATERGAEVRVALLGPNDWFGEMAVLDVQPRSATVRSVAPSLLVHLSSEEAERLIFGRDPNGYALVMRNLARELSRRLRVADGILAHMLGRINDVYVSGRS